MGCVASRLEEEEEVVSICRDRKHQLKLAVERRYALADAHYRYCQALYGVSAAIRLFVARHSSPASPFMITFPPPTPPSPPPENVVSNPLFLQQTPSEPTKEALTCESCESSTASDSSEEEIEERVEKEEPPSCGYFYMEMPQSMPSPHRDFGWDFFNPFTSVRPEIINGYNRISEEDLRVVREREGIPELEEEGERFEEESNAVVVEEKLGGRHHEESSRVEVAKAVNDSNVSQVEQKGLTVIDTPVRGRELLEALQDIEDHFIRAYDSGKELSRMLEVNRVQLQSNLEEIKGINYFFRPSFQPTKL